MTDDRVREAISKVIIDADRDWNGNVAQYRQYLVDRLIASGLFAAEPSSEIEALRARVKELEAESDLVKHLQAALMFWMPGVYAADTADNERAAKDAYLLAGFEGVMPDRCWGDEMLARADAAERKLSELTQR